MKSDDEDNEDNDKTETLDLQKGSINLGKIRATSIKTVQHLILPPPGNVRQEASLQWQMESMMRAAVEYEKEFCNQRGEPPSNLTSKELRGMKELDAKL